MTKSELVEFCARKLAGAAFDWRDLTTRIDEVLDAIDTAGIELVPSEADRYSEIVIAQDLGIDTDSAEYDICLAFHRAMVEAKKL